MKYNFRDWAGSQGVLALRENFLGVWVQDEVVLASEKKSEALVMGDF